MNLEIFKKQDSLELHPVYQSLSTVQGVRTFMKYHVFAVWDFMTLLKSLQRHVTCVSLPWIESEFDPEIVQLVNEIVLGEESDVDQNGKATSHFALYIKAMEEIGADTGLIKGFVKDLDLSKLPLELRKIVSFHLDIALNKKSHEVASSFFYGREKIIPTMFEQMVDVLNRSNIACETLKYYLERHIEVDSGDHGPKALRCLKGLTTSPEKINESVSIARDSLDIRVRLWDFIYSEMN